MTDLERWFWLVLLVACLVWYSTITIYVTVQGYWDIRQMLSTLGADRSVDGHTDQSPPP